MVCFDYLLTQSKKWDCFILLMDIILVGDCTELPKSNFTGFINFVQFVDPEIHNILQLSPYIKQNMKTHKRDLPLNGERLYT